MACTCWEDWHKRFGHISISGLQRLHAKGLVRGFDVDKTSKFGDCEACIAAKQTRNPDIWGPARTASVSGAKYFMTLIDDNSRHCTVKFIERQRERLPKRLRADNGKEYVNAQQNGVAERKNIMGGSSGSRRVFTE